MSDIDPVRSSPVAEKRLAEALRESESNFRLLFARNPHPIWVFDQETLAFLEVNEAAVDCYAYSRDEFLRMRVCDLLPPEPSPDLLSRFVLQSVDFERSGIWRHHRKNGQIVEVEAISHRLNFAGRKAVMVVAQDITERKRLQEERDYLMSSAQCLLWWADIYETGKPYLEWDIHYPNRVSAQRFLPLPLEEGESYRSGFYRCRLPEDRERCDRQGTVAIRAGQSYQQDFRSRRADGAIRWLHEDIHVEVVRPGFHWRAVGVCTDITERKRLEDQLLQAQKMESVGRLAGGVAHDFNNLLAVIAGHAELAEEELPPDIPALESIHIIRETTERAAELTRQLLAFARKQRIEPKVFSLNDLAVSMDRMLRRLIGEDIELVTRLHPEGGLIRADPGQCEQILVNLVVNARDAMPDGGRLLIETYCAHLDEDYARHHPPIVPGEYVVLSVSDTGMGIEEGLRGHIFEPFFTTKEPGKGTGLGLATVYGAVQQSGGTIWVYSEPGQGTTFKIFLPRIYGGAEAAPAQSGKSPAPRGTETLLVVEDKDSLRELAVMVLQRQGYTVLEAADGKEALEKAATYPATIHLLVTDVVMPQMGGRELAIRLREARPGLKVLYTSGYTDDTVIRNGALEAGIAFLQKPFTPSVLSTRVREVLDERPG